MLKYKVRNAFGHQALRSGYADAVGQLVGPAMVGAAIFRMFFFFVFSRAILAATMQASVPEPSIRNFWTEGTISVIFFASLYSYS